MNYKQAVFELWYWRYGTNPTNFHSKLYDLIGKADSVNRARLRGAYPIEVQVYEDWQRAETEAEFFADPSRDLKSGGAGGEFWGKCDNWEQRGTPGTKSGNP